MKNALAAPYKCSIDRVLPRAEECPIGPTSGADPMNRFPSVAFVPTLLALAVLTGEGVPPAVTRIDES